MEAFEGCESILLLGFAFYAIYIWGSFYVYLFNVKQMLYQFQDRLLMLVMPAACGVGMWWGIANLGDPYVRSDGFYLFFYWVWGVAWVAGIDMLLPLFGFSLRDDGVERRNTGATIALCGAFIGLTAAYTGGNIGEGPGWWVVLYCIVLSTGGLLLAWFVLEFFTQISETITIERNFAAGVRLGVLLAVIGFILGRAVTGTWIDMPDLIQSFVTRGWYVVPLVLVAIGIEWLARPSVQRPHPSGLLYGLFPAAAYIAVIAIVFTVAAAPLPPQ